MIEMIEIKCTEKQKEIIKKAMARSEWVCDLMTDVECGNVNTCADCIERNIKWDIRGNEDATN